MTEEKVTSCEPWKKAVLWLVLLFTICYMLPNEVQAAEKLSSISYCKLNSSGKSLYVKAKVSKKTKEMGKNLYLIGLNAYSKTSQLTTSKPLDSVKAKKGTIKFKVKYSDTLLYKKFVVAHKYKGKYKIISNAEYITNPENRAVYRGYGPKTYSKKGLQVEDTADSLELGVQHAVINWTLSSIINESGTPFQYKGRTYYFDESLLQYYDNLVKTYNDTGAKVTVILLLPNDSDPAVASMRFDGGAGAKFSSIKTSTKSGSYAFEAVMTYLAQRYGTMDHLVSGWILGNEVNSPWIWNYGGGRSFNTYMDNYVRTFRICYNAVKSVNKRAKVYISLDNNWYKDADGDGKKYFTAKSVLDAFYKKVNAEGKVTFNIAYHAYPQGMSDPIFWDDKQATNSTKSPIINFKNLSVLTKYVKSNFGKNYTIMLSEQSFNSTRGEEVQAAAYAYAYYISEADSMIESFIYGREFDHPTEGYAWGLCDGWRGKRIIWNVFQYIDSKNSFKFTNPLRKHTKLSSWKKINGFKDYVIKGMPSKMQQTLITEIKNTGVNSATMTWNKVLTADGYEIYRFSDSDPTLRLIETTPLNSITSYKDEGVQSGERYYYKIRMYKNTTDGKKLYGSFSQVQSILVSAGQVTMKVDETDVSGNEILIGWNKMSGVTGYEIARSTSADGGYVTIANTQKGSYTDEATSGGVTYYYKVRAYVTVGGVNHYGEYSTEKVSAQASIKLTAQPVNGVMTFNWTQWLDAPRYRIYCSVGNDDNFLLMQTVTGFSTSGNKFVNGGSGFNETFTKGKTYYFKARAYYEDKVYGEFSNIVGITIGDELDAVGTRDGVEDVIDPTAPVPSDTETPSTEVPETETPSTETPGTETPPTETPSTEAPSTETPPTEAPSTEVPPTETPSTETPGTETPSTEAPPAGTPSTEVPSTETKTTEVSTTEMPATEAKK